MTERLVVVGGVAAGMSAASKARRMNRSMEIVVYEKSGYVSYGSCGFPYFIKGEIPDINHVIVRTPEQFAQAGIEVHIRHEVQSVNPTERTVTVKNLDSGETFTGHWDKLLLTTGAVAVKPPIPGIELPGIFSLRTVEDALAIKNWIAEKKPKRGVVVGGGYIGLEMAEALAANGIEVTVFEMLPQVMPNMDTDMAEHVLSELKKQNVTVHLNHAVEKFEGSGQVETVISGDVREPAEIVIFSVGVRSNNVLAESAGVVLGPTDAIAVDDHQRTNVPNIWAAGDVAEAHHLVSDSPAFIPLGTTANKQGRVAGTNIGGGDAAFPGIVGTAVVKVFDLHAARTGLTERQAQELGHDVATATIKASARAHYMPEHPPVHVKLIFRKHDHKLLGAQMVGTEGVAKRIDVVAAALHAGWTTFDLGKLDLSYAPPFAPVWDPILVAANIANK